jgi:hypothetical protein
VRSIAQVQVWVEASGLEISNFFQQDVWIYDDAISNDELLSM